MDATGTKPPLLDEAASGIRPAVAPVAPEPTRADQPVQESATAPPPAEVPVEKAPQIATAEPSPEDSTLEGARHGLLYRAIARLGDKNREMILLREIQELKLEEIADMLGLPLGTVKSRSHRARLELAKAVRVLDPSYGA